MRWTGVKQQRRLPGWTRGCFCRRMDINEQLLLCPRHQRELRPRPRQSSHCSPVWKTPRIGFAATRTGGAGPALAHIWAEWPKCEPTLDQHLQSARTPKLIEDNAPAVALSFHGHGVIRRAVIKLNRVLYLPPPPRHLLLIWCPWFCNVAPWYLSGSVVGQEGEKSNGFSNGFITCHKPDATFLIMNE